MTGSLVVLLGDRIAGMVSRSARGVLRFLYADGYEADATPLSLSMPTQLRSHPDRAVVPWMQGLLPDNDAVLARWGRQFQVSPSSPFALLSTPVGEDCAGAVRFVHPDRVDEALGREGKVVWLTDDDVAQRLMELQQDATAWLGSTFAGPFSLGGAQAKTALLRENGRWGVPSGSIPTTHILKPAVAGLDGHDLNEHLCLDAAHRAGLLVARSEIFRFADQTALIVERYDRLHDGTRTVRVHQEDLCQALGVSPFKKYQNEGGPGVADVAGLLRRSMAASHADVDVWRFADALIWNWVIGGTDAHAKNYSVLLDGSDVRLAPLYDVASVLPYDVHERKLRLAMKIGGDYHLFPRRNTWPTAARDLGLAADALVERCRQLASAAPEAFAEAAATPGVVSVGSPLPGKLVDLVADRSARCLQVL